MKILSNFDTQLSTRQLQRAKKIFGDEGALFIRRDVIYLVFKFYLPLFFVLCISGLTLRGITSIKGDGFAGIARGFLWILLAVSIVYFCRVSIGKLIDHYMDYIIITPHDITLYDQEGILKRSSNSLDASKIKTVSVRQYGLLGSIFNYGSLIFFAEGDAQDDQVGHIRLNYIRSPRRVKAKIAKIISLGQEEHIGTQDSLQQHMHKFQQEPQH